jgi:hypothetical protein
LGSYFENIENWIASMADPGLVSTGLGCKAVVQIYQILVLMEIPK